MTRLAAWFVDDVTAGRMLLWFGITVAFVLSFAVYFVPAVTGLTGGLRPIDTQFPITAQIIFRDLARYPPEAIRVYGWFLFVDCCYPVALAAFISDFWGWSIRYTDAARLRVLARQGWVLLPFAGALLDLAENVCFFLIIAAWPEQALWTAARIGTGLRQTKLTVQVFALLITLALLVLVIRTKIGRQTTGHSQH